jgi:hypothetical protein
MGAGNCVVGATPRVCSDCPYARQSADFVREFTSDELSQRGVNLLVFVREHQVRTITEAKRRSNDRIAEVAGESRKANLRPGLPVNPGALDCTIEHRKGQVIRRGTPGKACLLLVVPRARSSAVLKTEMPQTQPRPGGLPISKNYDGEPRRDRRLFGQGGDRRTQGGGWGLLRIV